MVPRFLALITALPACLGILSPLRAAEGDSIVRDDRVGVCTHFAFPGNGWPTDEMVPLIAHSGAGWIRDDLFWGAVEKSPGEYQIPETAQHWIDAVSASGVKIDVVFDYGNKIYADHYDPEAYAKAAAWTARQLAGKIQAIEILNEPANFGFSKYYDNEQAWSGFKKDGTLATYVGKYVTLLNTAAKAIRAANPTIKIIGLGMSPGANFHAIAMGIAPEVDGITDHPYSPWGMAEFVPPIIQRDGVAATDKKGTFVSEIKLYGEQSARYHGPREIWLTEEGWPTFHPAKPFGMFGPVTVETQAKYILRRLSESEALGVSTAFVYDLRDDGADPTYNEDNFGLLDHFSQPKPSYTALQRFCAAMAGFRPEKHGAVTIAPHSGLSDNQLAASARAYAFADDKGTPLILVWDAKKDDASFTPPETDIEIDVDKPVSKISAYDPLTGDTHDVPFQAAAGHIVLQDFSLPDSPVFLTLTMASGH